jgi:hypothetical protein
VRPVALLMILMLAACSAAPSPGKPSPGEPPAPAGGSVLGRIISQQADGSNRHSVAGQAVGAFTQAVRPGLVLQHPPAPLATTVTAADGRFAFHRLRPGRYFITIAGAGPSIAGHWVVVTAERGATVLLTQCLNCTGPL